MRQLRHDQLQEIRRLFRQWQQFPAPCGISFADPYNPCLPELDDDGRLVCLTCWSRQRLALEAGA